MIHLAYCCYVSQLPWFCEHRSDLFAQIDYLYHRPTVVVDQMRSVSKQVHLDSLPKWRYTDPITGEDHYE